MCIGLKRNTVAIKRYNPRWSDTALETTKILKNILGDDVVDIQHVGSTAIQGIFSKPIIDIAVGVKDFDTILSFNDKLNEVNIIYRGSDIEDQLLYVMGDFEKDTRTHHIHVVIHNSPEWNNYINFRNFLRANKDFADKYCELKRSLCEKFPDNRYAYTKGKQDFINDVLKNL